MENFDGFESLEGLENFKGFDNPAYEFEESINQPFEVKSGKKGSHKNFVGNEYGQNGASTETLENARPVDDVWYESASDEEEAPEEFYTVGDEWYKPTSDEEEAPEEFYAVGDEWYKPTSDEEKAPEEFYTVGDEWYKPASDEMSECAPIESGKGG